MQISCEKPNDRLVTEFKLTISKEEEWANKKPKNRRALILHALKQFNEFVMLKYGIKKLGDKHE